MTQKLTDSRIFGGGPGMPASGVDAEGHGEFSV